MKNKIVVTHVYFDGRKDKKIYETPIVEPLNMKKIKDMSMKNHGLISHPIIFQMNEVFGMPAKNFKDFLAKKLVGNQQVENVTYEQLDCISGCIVMNVTVQLSEKNQTYIVNEEELL